MSSHKTGTVLFYSQITGIPGNDDFCALLFDPAGVAPKFSDGTLIAMDAIPDKNDPIAYADSEAWRKAMNPNVLCV